MNIAQVAPLFENHPPGHHSAAERLASFLTGELVALGHEVTFFSAPDARHGSERRFTAADEAGPADLGDPRPWQVLQLEQVFREASRFDILHFHDGYHHLPLARRAAPPALTTFYGPIDTPGVASLMREFDELSLIAVSDAQRRPLPWANWNATIPPGLPDNLYRFQSSPGSYLAFLGALAPDTGIEDAVEIARRAGLPLRIAGSVDRLDAAYFQSRVRPMLSARGIEFEGTLAQNAKQDFLDGALALLVPLQRDEPLGLTMIEALACGTPVVAYRRGAVTEVVDPGVSGQVVTDVAGAVTALESVAGMDRWRCRRAFEQRFLARRMTSEYLSAYERLAAGEPLINVRR